MKKNADNQDRNKNGTKGQGHKYRESHKNVERELVVIPPIPKDMQYDSHLSDDSYWRGYDSENTHLKPMLTEVVGPGLIYDENLNKYMDGLKLKIKTAKPVPMHLACVDDQGYVHLTPACDEGEKALRFLKQTMVMIFGDNSLVTEGNKLCNFQDLIIGEIVVAKIIISSKHNIFEFVRGRVIRISLEVQEATIIDVDTMTEYNVPSHLLYRAFKTVMTLPFQAIQCRLKGLSFFEGTDVLKTLADSTPSVKHPPPCGFSCTIDSSQDIPTVKIKKYGIPDWNCTDDLLRHMGTAMGAKYRLVSGMYQAYISNIDEYGNIWIQYPEDRYLLDKLKSLLQESAPLFAKCVQEAPLTLMTVEKGSRYLARFSKNNFKRVIVRVVDLDGYYAKTMTKTDHKRVLIECVDFGNKFWISEDELMLLESFPKLIRYIPDMSQRVRLVGIKSFSKSVQEHQFCGRKFNVEIISEWPKDAHAVEVKMEFVQCGDVENEEKFDLTQSLEDDPETVFYSNEEMEETIKQRREEWESNENKDKKECNLDPLELKDLPPFIVKQLKVAHMRALKGPVPPKTDDGDADNSSG